VSIRIGYSSSNVFSRLSSLTTSWFCFVRYILHRHLITEISLPHIQDGIWNWRLQKSFRPATPLDGRRNISFYAPGAGDGVGSLGFFAAPRFRHLPCTHLNGVQAQVYELCPTQPAAPPSMTSASEFHRQGIVIGARAETINEDMIEGFQVGQFAQERDHIRGRADVAELTQ